MKGAANFQILHKHTKNVRRAWDEGRRESISDGWSKESLLRQEANYRAYICAADHADQLFTRITS